MPASGWMFHRTEFPLSTQLIKSTGLVSGLTLVSRILGFVRDMVIAGFFGANAGTDAFFVAFKIPNFLRRLFAEGAFAQAFVPVLSSVRERQGDAFARDFIARISGSFALVLSVLTCLGIVASPWLIWLFAPGFHDKPDQYDISVELLRITFPYLFFICLTALCGGILNTWNHFTIPAFTPVLLNISMITATVWLAPRFDQPIHALGWGVFAAGLLQLAFQLPALHRLGLLPFPKINFKHPDVQRVLQLMAPAVFGASVSQLNLLINTLIASLLATGSISWLYYSDRLVEFPLGIFGAGLGTVILPHLSRSQARQDTDQFSQSIDWALRWLLIIGLPATLGLIFLAEPLMYTLFQYDKFTSADSRMAARSLMAYGIGLMGFLSVKILVPAFSAQQDLRTPARFGVYSVVVNLALSAMLALWLAPPGWAHAGLALAASLAAITNAALLLATLYRRKVYRPRAGFARFILTTLAANLGMAVLLTGLMEGLNWQGLAALGRVTQLGACILAAMLVYSLILLLLGLRPRHMLLTGTS